MPYKKGKDRIDYQRNLRGKRAAEGLCTRCGAIIAGEKLDCEACLAKSNAIVQGIAAKHLADGRCRCGQNSLLGKRVCERCKRVSRETLRELKKTVIAAYGGKCVCCGESMYEFLSIDHKHNDGAKERKQLGAKGKSGASFFRLIIAENFPDRYQLLCYNCNMSKGFFGYCPHNPEIKFVVRRTL